VERPPTKYLSLGEDRIAYQVFGDGDTHALHLKAFGASVDSIWEHAAHLRVWRTLQPHLRTIVFDHRGVGVSDAPPLSRLGDLDDRLEEVLAVLDEVGVERVSVCGEYDEVPLAIKLAVEHPERVERLVLVNGYAKRCKGDGYPYGPSPEEAEVLAELTRTVWGTGEAIAFAVPTLADDRDFTARLERLGARPGLAAAWNKAAAAVDVRRLLPRVEVPTLVIYSGDILTVMPEQSRHLAEEIAGAQLLELSSSTFYWGGGVVEAIVKFMSDAPSTGDRDLATLLVTDVVDSTGTVVTMGDREWRHTLDVLDDLVTSRKGAGRVVKQTGDGHVIEFGLPRDAIRTADALARAVEPLGVALRSGVHTGEIERRENGDIGGLTVHVAARVAALAGAGEVLVSRTVAELLGASDYVLTDRGTHALKGVPGEWALFAVQPR
jgi:class 3 adenylate cyclase